MFFKNVVRVPISLHFLAILFLGFVKSHLEIHLLTDIVLAFDWCTV